jgi:hydroxymethylbilane synthase
MKLVLGTRGSDLALAQSRMVRDGLLARHHGLEVELKIITTTGDARTAMPLHEPTAEGAGLFTKQLEEALISGEIDLAVHSLKDLPVETPAGLVLPAILPRAPVADLLISRLPGGVKGLPEGATVGSSSPRRALLLKRIHPTLRIIPIRGNVPTRIEKIAGGDYDATILAAAGLGRLGHDLSSGTLRLGDKILYLESLDWMLPAPGQGAIAVETRAGDDAERVVAVLHDPVTASCVEAERGLLRHLGGGCHLALGALATPLHGGFLLRAAFIPDQDDLSGFVSGSAVAATPEEAAIAVAHHFLGRRENS